ncbi:MAG: hypothetical protein ACI9MR_000262 [Myxococcota bacterium]|jgi:hypothetical protein
MPLLALGLVFLLAACVDQADDMGAVADTVDTRVAPDDPGRVTWRRLNRQHYDNTVRDLLGTTLLPGRDLPADDLGYGFDSIAEVLSISPLHLELYEDAAARLAEDALPFPKAEPVTQTFEAESMDYTGGGQPQGGWFVLYSNGVVYEDVTISHAGSYEISALVYAAQAGPDLAELEIRVDGEAVLTTDVIAADRGAAEVHTVEVKLEPGTHRVGLAFTNDYYIENVADRNLFIDYLEVVGPTGADLTDWDPSFVLRCDVAQVMAEDEACARDTLATLATRAYRRPVEAAEVDGLMALFKAARADDISFVESLRLPVQALLMSPQFLFRAEFQADPDDPADTPLNGWAIATRLSYLLWSTMPDEALFEAAAEGRLDTAEGITEQVRRMLQDPKSVALVDDFASQWLYIRDIDNTFPDAANFPTFDEPLREAMVAEMRRFFKSFVGTGRSMIELLTSDETYVNARLAAHYGMDPLGLGDALEPVSLTGTGRRGLLTQSGLLTALSTPFRTSIVRRGKWVLGQLLCDEPRQPPAGVEALMEASEGLALTLRAKMEMHVTDEGCATCHRAMDPIGFALENFDGVGAWRTTDNGQPIDSTGEFPDGTTFDDALGMVDALATDVRYPRCVAEKVFVYALGRGYRKAFDWPYLDGIVIDFASGNHTLEALLVAVATSEPFRRRTGEVAQ